MRPTHDSTYVYEYIFCKINKQTPSRLKTIIFCSESAFGDHNAIDVISVMVQGYAACKLSHIVVTTAAAVVAQRTYSWLTDCTILHIALIAISVWTPRKHHTISYSHLYIILKLVYTFYIAHCVAFSLLIYWHPQNIYICGVWAGG